MNTTTNYTVQFLADSSIKLDELENEMKNYPASSLVNFLWLYQLKLSNDPRFNEAAKKSGIYLQNPYWMQLQLSGIEIPKDNEREEAFEQKIDEGLPIPVNEPTYATDSQIIENPVFENNNPADENSWKDQNEESIVLNENEGEEILEQKKEDESKKTVNEPTYAADRQIVENPVLENQFQDDQNNEEVSSVEFVGSNENEGEEILEQENEDESNQTVNEQIVENPVLENQFQDDQNIGEVKDDESNVSKETRDEEILEQKKENESNQTVNEQIVENPVLKNEFQDDQNIEEVKNDVSVASNENEEDHNKLTEKNSGDEQKENQTVDGGDSDDSIPFEPLHTVDYFASQGIKLSEESLNDDQLGKQVKSFTAWLKSMKKLHPGQLPEQNEVIERIIQTSSEASNQSANVLTEAMAEVLIKQGKSEKAIEMYQKLSLIYPSKSAYFAAKIESLKII